MPDTLEIDGAQAELLLGGDQPPVLLDVREDYERAAGRIPGSLHIPLAQLPERAGEIAPGAAVIVYCRAGVRSLMAAQALSAAGYDAVSLAGGLVDWAAAQRAIEPPGGTVADHGAAA